MKLKKLLKELPLIQVKGSKEIEITGICANSRRVAPGNLFIARKGMSFDGTLFIPEAIASGASAVATDIYNPLLDKSVTQLIHPDVSSIEGLLAAHFYQFPSNDLYMVGITGTNGKTTTSYLVKHLLEQAVGECGLIGTIEYLIGKHKYQATRTTPDVTTNQKMLREMVLSNCTSAVMETTSHALQQGRVDYIDFDIGIFTNLSLEHLDYHKTMEQYAEAKNILFRSLDPSKKKNHPYPKTAIINLDSAWSPQILKACPAEILTYSLNSEQADLTAKELSFSTSGTSMKLLYRGEEVDFRCQLVGRFNVYNCLAAIAVGLVRAMPLKQICNLLSAPISIPGRLQAVPNDLGLKIYVDFAHTDDALLNVFECLKEFKDGRLITVFGCGGERDPFKRPRMAQVCEKWSEFTFVTSDNPRNEDPNAIVEQIIQGFTHQNCYTVELDRRKAIAMAIEMANPSDIILIAGKGHETYQIFAHQTIEFDDSKVAFELCKQKNLTFVQ